MAAFSSKSDAGVGDEDQRAETGRVESSGYEVNNRHVLVRRQRDDLVIRQVRQSVGRALRPEAGQHLLRRSAVIDEGDVGSKEERAAAARGAAGRRNDERARGDGVGDDRGVNAGRVGSGAADPMRFRLRETDAPGRSPVTAVIVSDAGLPVVIRERRLRLRPYIGRARAKRKKRTAIFFMAK